MPNQGHEKEAARQEDEIIRAAQNGTKAAQDMKGMSTNPHDGGSPEWWAWHDAYKEFKRWDEGQKRQLQRGNR